MTNIGKTQIAYVAVGGGGDEGGLKIVDGMLVGSGELEGDTYTINGLNVEDGVAII